MDAARDPYFVRFDAFFSERLQSISTSGEYQAYIIQKEIKPPKTKPLLYLHKLYLHKLYLDKS